MGPRRENIVTTVTESWRRSTTMTIANGRVWLIACDDCCWQQAERGEQAVMSNGPHAPRRQDDRLGPGLELAQRRLVAHVACDERDVIHWFKTRRAHEALTSITSRSPRRAVEFYSANTSDGRERNAEQHDD